MDAAGRIEDMVGRPVPDVDLPSSAGGVFSLRSRIGLGPLRVAVRACLGLFGVPAGEVAL